MNKNRTIIVCLVVIILALVTYISLYKSPSASTSGETASSLFQTIKNVVNPAYDLPSTFTITTHGDFTSSGGTRTLDEKYSFVNNVLVSGTATYFDGAGGGCTQNCNNTEQCVITDNQWVEVQKWGGCERQFGSVPSKQSLESKIKSGDLIPKNATSCIHDGYCYEITTP